jgi:hypothetical protein
MTRLEDLDAVAAALSEACQEGYHLALLMLRILE